MLPLSLNGTFQDKNHVINLKISIEEKMKVFWGFSEKNAYDMQHIACTRSYGPYAII